MQQILSRKFDIQDAAEGSRESEEAQEPVSPLQTTTVPAFGGDNRTHSPSAETGLVAAISVLAEGRDRADNQDSSRTTAEVNATPVPQDAAKIGAGKMPLVLIIEDTTELAEVIQATLEHNHMLTAHTTHGGKALAKLDEINPDVVLLDITLPDMKGWDLLQALKAKKGAKPMPAVIVITAHGDPANRLVGKLQGVQGYLVKPFTADQLEKIVAEVLSGAAR
ncbi:MAG: response regulator [Burkholderiales bacterium]|nr:response regulator [Anaerolineae bacterium]